MQLCVACPLGHPTLCDESKRGRTVACPQCLTLFVAELDFAGNHARPEKGKARKSRDDDDDDDEDDEEDEKPVKKKAKKRDDEDDEDDDDDDDDDFDDGPEPIRWTPKKRQMNIVNIGMMAYLIGFYVMLILMVLMFLGESLFLIFLTIGIFAPAFLALAALVVLIVAFASGVGGVVIYVCNLVGWITGLFAPAKSEGRSSAITALCFFLSPSLLYLAYLILWYSVIDRDEHGFAVSFRLLQTFNGIAFLLVMMAFYTTLVYIGRIAGFLGMTTDKYKPQALGWFIVGGTIILIVLIIVEWLIMLIVASGGILLFIALYVVSGMTFNCFYFVISSMRELIGVVTRIRAQIADYIQNG